MRIVTWNVNSLRVRLQRVQAWLEKEQPDALCLQELKAEDSAFPFAALEEVGYRAAIHGQKTYNGVAILSREEAKDVVIGLDDGVEDPQARLIAATIGDVRVICGYFPNGSTMESDKYPYKLEWLKRLHRYLEKRHSPEEKLVLCGDFNVAFDDRDMKNVSKWQGGVLYNEEVVQRVQDLLDWGLVDSFRQVHEEGGIFTWWDYRGLSFPQNDGLRIDHLLVTESLVSRIAEVRVDRDQRKKGACPDATKASDHAPVVLYLSD
ncbi:MAG: exodeoxyribonuclease-3 [Planctomycetota bacterium]|jgi:exodeoxyribonuclease-3